MLPLLRVALGRAAADASTKVENSLQNQYSKFQLRLLETLESNGRTSLELLRTSSALQSWLSALLKRDPTIAGQMEFSGAAGMAKHLQNLALAVNVDTSKTIELLEQFP